jgi:hypothetical protein
MLFLNLATLALLPALAPGAQSEATSPEDQALAYLAREVPRWSRENHCFSCHNNGDAARALYAGLRAGFRIEPAALAETTAWLSDPERWDRNGGDGPFSDKRLARVQFSTALLAADRAGKIPDRGVLRRAAARLARDQAPDGSWPLEGENEPGAPATYGPFLASLLARENLRAADPIGFREALDRADRWLLAHPIENVMDASVMLMVRRELGLPPAGPEAARCMDLLNKSQSEHGGWGPFVSSAPENFDTALAVLALSTTKDCESTRTMIGRGRAFLIGQQQPDGSWIETTRPPGAESYAQRISTTGWATIALIATRGCDPSTASHAK